MRRDATLCDIMRQDATWCDATQCDKMRHDATWCDKMRRYASRCDMMRHDATLCDAMRQDATRCDMMRRDTMKCDAIAFLSWYVMSCFSTSFHTIFEIEKSIKTRCAYFSVHFRSDVVLTTCISVNFVTRNTNNVNQYGDTWGKNMKIKVMML